MHFKSVTFMLATAAMSINAQEITGQLGDAKVVTNNPAGVVYEAHLPETAFTKGSAYAGGGNVKGFISATASPDGVGVVFTVKFSNLPKEGGPFKYHLHAAPGSNGNCTSTLAHLDPFLRGENPPCNASAPQSCEVGDLSGKHGEVKSDPFEATYTDKFASTHEGIGAFFGNRSFVFHYANKTRISCANFVRKGHKDNGGNCSSPGHPKPSGSGSAPSGVASGTEGATPKQTSPPPIPAGAATLSVGMAGFFIAAAAALLLPIDLAPGFGRMGQPDDAQRTREAQRSSEPWSKPPACYWQICSSINDRAISCREMPVGLI
ncbi:hypothetical protein PpBr36_05259 [Pyricularia pennisetigena]|uniref:hypothetical protein n=1 Tax=Pyricularia pennisetigena TaxID=1578925 RepID=UPI0011528D9E|nr:hypothetical protein PpBr36_05259 [Pyricularia pennisetigena]TLS26163.1 hypothetical protein PpBr36_05259 [Pyricularia pennisetigena]